MLRSTLLTLFACTPLLAQQTGDKPAGHSNHGEVFNEGPRQSAYLMGGTGDVHFPVTTKSEQAQRFFDQGVGQLHGFWYYEAERSFRQVAALDPECAMSFWGMAMANTDNGDRAPGFAHEGWKRRESVTPRERRFIEATARYWAVDKDIEPATSGDKAKQKIGSKPDEARRRRLIEDLEAIVGDFPDDIEAKALLVNALWLNQRDADMKISSRQANEALLDQVFAKAPMHPAHHYRIHLWDEKDTAHRVLSSAARSGQSAPGIAHMWHMSGHTFAKLGRHADAAWQQEASARVDHAHMMRDRVLPDQIFNYPHNNEWLVRSLCDVGRVREAIDLAKNMIELPRHPRFNTLEGGPSHSARYGRERLLATIEDFELWSEVPALAETMYLEPGDSPRQQSARCQMIGRAHLAAGRVDQARAALAELDAFLAQEKTARSAAVDKAEAEALARKDDKDKVRAAMNDALAAHEEALRDIRGLQAVLSALLALHRHEGEAATALATLDDSQLPITQRALLHLEYGDSEQAEKLARQAVDERKGAALPLATLAWVLWSRDKQTEANATFDDLRALSSRFDLDMPAFARLQPLVEARSLSRDWRIAETVGDDVGERPPLDSLGPFRWAPSVAPSWRLAAANGKQVALADYAGRPVVVSFFLGFGCVHCVEQLQAFKLAAADFAAAGIDLVTIGTDSVAQLTESQAGDSEDERFPFPILADPELEIFKAYRCHDDFEGMALHGTFLLDAEQRVRWQDISYEPFTDAAFVLREAKRLLALPVHG